jgi:anti-sigma B factor antagonist
MRGFKRLANPFAVQQSHLNDLSVLALEGFLDAHTAPAFEQAIQKEMEGGRLRMIVNCEKLTYISSAGLGVFMSFIEEIREQGGDIKICGLIPKVRQVFEILGFASLFDILDTLPEAAQKFSKPAPQER